MKKFFSVLFIAFCFFAINFQNAEARIDDSKIKLGGIGPGDHMSDMIAIYGQPDDFGPKIYRPKIQEASYVVYGKGKSQVKIEFSIYFKLNLPLKGDERIEKISVSSNNGFKTPDGVAVGMSESILTEKYGEPEFVNKFEDYGSMDKCYGGYLYWFRFGVKDGKITYIIAEFHPEYVYRKKI